MKRDLQGDDIDLCKTSYGIVLSAMGTYLFFFFSFAYVVVLFSFSSVYSMFQQILHFLGIQFIYS